MYFSILDYDTQPLCISIFAHPIKSIPMIRLALFADIHGKFLLPFKLAHHYQQTTGKSIDLNCPMRRYGRIPG